MKDLQLPQYAPKILFTDNQGAIALAKNPEYHAHTKHIDIKLHFIRQHIEEGWIQLIYCPTDDMIADIMTEALAKEKHKKFVRWMGLTTTTPSPFEDSYRIGMQVGGVKTKETHRQTRETCDPAKTVNCKEIGSELKWGTWNSDSGASYLCYSSCASFKAEL